MQAQEAANNAYSETLEQTGSELLAQQAASKAYLDANGGLDLDTVIEVRVW